MSANKKTLQNRFTKIRSKSGRLSKMMAAVMSAAIAVTMLGGIVVMAAVGSDGLEHWDKNEIYILGSMRLSVDADIENAPQWIKDISSDGKLTLMINKTDMRDTSGLVTHSNTATVNGDKGKETLTRTGTSGYYNTEVVKSDTEYDWAVMLLTYNITDNGNIDTDNIYVRFTTETDNLAMYMGLDYKAFQKDVGFDRFSKGYNVQFIGDYENAEKVYNNGIYVNYFTYFENKYDNRNVENIDLNIAQADNDRQAVGNIHAAPFLHQDAVGVRYVMRPRAVDQSDRNPFHDINCKRIRKDAADRNAFNGGLPRQFRLQRSEIQGKQIGQAGAELEH